MTREEIIRKLQQNEIKDLKYLEELNLNISKIRELPENIGKLTNLERLHLSDTKIEKLSESIGDLTNLESEKIDKKMPKFKGGNSDFCTKR